jgi:hypothetical protein
MLLQCPHFLMGFALAMVLIFGSALRPHWRQWMMVIL